MAEITKAAWEAKGAELFGPDFTKWKFVCPKCGIEMSIVRVHLEFEPHLAALRAAKFVPYAECIGRHVPGVGCDWAAYGLFRGPVLVGDGDQVVPAFDFVGQPFTRAPLTIPGIPESRCNKLRSNGDGTMSLCTVMKREHEGDCVFGAVPRG